MKSKYACNLLAQHQVELDLTLRPRTIRSRAWIGQGQIPLWACLSLALSVYLFTACQKQFLERATPDLGMALLKGDHAGRKGKRATRDDTKHHDGS